MSQTRLDTNICSRLDVFLAILNPLLGAETSKNENTYIRIPRISSVKTQLMYCQLKWRHVSTQWVIIRPITEPCLRYIKWKCKFLGSQNVYNS